MVTSASTEGSQTTDLESVRRFAHALHAALYDCRLERARQKIVYYYDADVMVPVVGGLLAESHSKLAPVNQRGKLVRALLSAGYLGTVSMLRPHVLELDGEIKQYPDYGRKGQIGEYSRRVQEFIKVNGVIDDMKKLRRIVTGKRSVTDFIDFMQKSGYRSFPVLELAHGTWFERLRRLLDYNLTFDEENIDIRRVLQTSSFTLLHEAISEKSGPQRSAGNNLRDATALALLHDYIARRGEGEESVPHVRFYTETNTLQRLWAEDDKVRGILSYPSGSQEPDAGDFIVRDADYFILRAAFQELHLPGLEVVATAQGEATWEQLTEIDRELFPSVEAGLDSVGEQLESLELGNERLKTVVNEFESLALVRNVWSKYKLPESLSRHLPGWTDTWHSVVGDLDGAILEKITATRDELHKEVERLQTWNVRFGKLMTNAEGVKRRLDGEDEAKRRLGIDPAPLPDPMRDLGLVRWGMELSATGQERLQENIARTIRGTQAERGAFCATLAADVDEPDMTSDRFGVFCATLWFLEAYDLISTSVGRYELLTQEDLDMSFLVMNAAALLKAQPAMTRKAKSDLLTGLDNLQSNARSVEEIGYPLGIGYCYFVAWASETHSAGPGKEAATEELIRNWAKKSVLAGIDGVKLYPPLSLQAAFSVNHIVYAGTVTEEGLNEAGEYVDQLVKLRGRPDIWHYRFADTLAYHNYHTARAAWKLHMLQRQPMHRQHARDDVLAPVYSLLTEALELIDEARDTYGDPEIPQHRLEISRFFDQLRLNAGTA